MAVVSLLDYIAYSDSIVLCSALSLFSFPLREFPILPLESIQRHPMVCSTLRTRNLPKKGIFSGVKKA